jgi:hypothetical protein
MSDFRFHHPIESACLDCCKRKKIPVPDEWQEKISSVDE